MTPNISLLPNQVLLTFEDKETAEYVRLVCRRKGTDLPAYILDNFEWDDPIECLSSFNEDEKITAATCEGCEHNLTCPDAVKKKAGGRS